jgi:hypothetical protein
MVVRATTNYPVSASTVFVLMSEPHYRIFDWPYALTSATIPPLFLHRHRARRGVPRPVTAASRSAFCAAAALSVPMLGKAKRYLTYRHVCVATAAGGRGRR